MSYSYDRQAADKTWYDVFNEAQQTFMGKVIKELAKQVKGKAEEGGFASGSVIYANGTATLQLGFTGGSIGTIYVINTQKKRTEYSVVAYTPQTFVQYLLHTLKL